MSDVRMLDFERAVTATIVTDVQISPDGSQVAYSVSPASADKDGRVSEIWLVSAEGGAPQRLTTSSGIDAYPRWSPDGSRIAFISDRANRGVTQVYVIELAGGEAIQLTTGEGAVSQLAWSPNGSKIAYLAVDPETEEEKKKKEEGNDIKVVEADVKGQGLWVIDVPAGLASLGGDDMPEPKRISPEGQHVGGTGGGLSWSPDGSRIVSPLTPSPKAHYTFIPDLAFFSMDGEVENMGSYDGLLGAPSFSPDGETLAMIAAEDVIPALFSLQTMPVKGGDQRIVAPGIEGSFMGAKWLPDGKRAVVVFQSGQQDDFRVIDMETGELSPAVTGLPPGGIGFTQNPMSISADGSKIAFCKSSDSTFADVYIADLGGEAKKLTDLNPWVADYDFGEVREISWKSKDGMQIEGMLILPVGYEEGTRYPLMTHIHGGPCGAWTRDLQATWHNWGQFLAQRGYAVFLPNPRGSSGKGTAFLCEIVNCYGEPDWDDIITGVDYLIDEGIADGDQLVVGGWSGGGFLTNWTITHSDRFKAAVSGAGIANWVSFQGTADVRSVFNRYLGDVESKGLDTHWRLSPIRLIQNVTTPTLILYGEADDRVPPSQGHELFEGLKSVGVETELVLYPGEPHGIGGRLHQLDVLERAIGWYERHLGRN